MNEIKPKYYNKNGISLFDIIDSYELDFYLGNILKYILRCKFKENLLLDLNKAKEYLNEKIKRLENKQ